MVSLRSANLISTGIPIWGGNNSTAKMAQPDQPPDTDQTKDVEIEHVLNQLDILESEVSDDYEREQVQQVRSMLEYVPGTEVINKYTSRDMGEAFVGGLVFSLPMLVEDGVFDIAEWFTTYTIASIPILLVLNVVFVVAIAAGLLYAVDFREVQISEPIFGLIPRRLVGVLAISFGCALGMMVFWGRLHHGDPSSLEAASRTTVIWAAAVLGAVLADILPGESKGEDINILIEEIGPQRERKGE